MDCRTVKDKLSEYVDNELSSHDAEQIKQHLSECSECRREYDEIKMTIDCVRQLPKASAPDMLTMKTMAVVQRHDRRAKARTMPRLMPIAAAVAALCIFSVAVFGLLTMPGARLMSDSDMVGMESEPAPGDMVAVDDVDDAAYLAAPDDTDRGHIEIARVDDDSAEATSFGHSAPLSFERMVVRRGEVHLETEEFDRIYEQVVLMADLKGGFVQDSRMWTRHQDNESYRQAQIVMRVPADSYTRVVAELVEMGEVTSRSESGHDVTEEYYDVDARLRNLERQERRLLEILQQADTVDEVLRVEQELARVRGQIEQLQGRLRFLDSQVRMSTVTAIISEPMPEDEEPVNGEPDLWERMVRAFVLTFKWLGAAIERVLIILAGAIPVLLFLGLVYVGYRRLISR